MTISELVSLGSGGVAIATVILFLRYLLTTQKANRAEREMERAESRAEREMERKVLTGIITNDLHEVNAGLRCVKDGLQEVVTELKRRD